MIIEIQDLVIWLIGLLIIYIVSPKEELAIIVPIICSIIWTIFCFLLFCVFDWHIPMLNIEFVWRKIDNN